MFLLCNELGCEIRNEYCLHLIYRELVEELHPLMKEALERRPEVTHSQECERKETETEINLTDP